MSILDLVDQLLAQTGVHVGTSRDTRDDVAAQIARIVVTALPGRAGVMFDYEGLSLDQQRRRAHAEHAILARTSSGLSLYTAHVHAPVLTELRETEPGSFTAAEGASPFPLSIRVEVPSAGRLIYTWTFGEPGAKSSVRITADVTLVD